MRNIVGNPARGESFFPRERVVAKLISRIKAGNNLQLAAPRRVGKTSILFYLQDNSIEGYIYVYVDTESISDEQEFYKKILKEISRNKSIASSNRLQKLLKAGAGILSRVKSINVLGGTLEFKEDDADVNYREELTNFLAGFELESETKLILLLDEFPQTILNIVAQNDNYTKAAIRFLQSNRELRQNPDINTKVQFIYTGSIGLNHTVAAINASAFVNDLSAVEVEPLTEAEAGQLITKLLQERNIAISDTAIAHLLQKVEWYIPFHIQLAIQELIDISANNQRADEAAIDEAFQKIIASRNNSHFEHYYSRLRTQFKGNEFKYADELLSTLAGNGTISRAQLFDKAIPYELEDTYRTIIDILESDGYINYHSQTNIYRFNSPIVRMWWQKYKSR